MRLKGNQRLNLIPAALLCGAFGIALFIVPRYDSHEIEGLRETALTLRQVIQQGQENAFSPKRLRVELSDKRYATLGRFIAESHRRGFIGEEQKEELRGKFVFEGQRYPVKLRLKGDWTDHLGTHISLRIALRGKERFDGLREWNLQSPGSRKFLNEWLLMRALEQEDVLVPRHEYVSVRLQDRPEMPYLLIEHFSKELIERQKRREGLILHMREGNYFEYKRAGRSEGRTRESDSEIAAYSQGRIDRTPALSRQFAAGNALLEKLRSREVPPSQVLDVDRLARLIAIYDVFGAGHGFLWFNMRFYFDPLRGLLEPIAYDGNAGRIYSEDAPPKHYSLVNHILRDPVILKAYHRELSRISDPEYLTAFLDAERAAIEMRHDFLRGDPSYNGKPDQLRSMLLHNAAWLRENGISIPHPDRQIAAPRTPKNSFPLPKDWAWKTEKGRRWLVATPGTVRIEEDWLLPPDVGLRLPPGTRLRVADGQVIAVRGPVDFRGTLENPILLEASESKWGGLVVLEASDTSTLEHVQFSGVAPNQNAKGPERDGWFQTGGITFAYSDVQGHHIRFIDFQTEDALNVFAAEVSLSDLVFKDVVSDAFDGDFIRGSLADIRIDGAAGDGLDFSGSDLEIRRVHASRVKDKAMSVGEASLIRVNELEVLGGGFGIVAKDGSEVHAENISVRDTRIGLATYTKKSAYGAAKMTVQGYTMAGSSFGHLAQTGSTLVLDGRRLPVRDFDSADLYAGSK